VFLVLRGTFGKRRVYTVKQFNVLMSGPKFAETLTNEGKIIAGRGKRRMVERSKDKKASTAAPTENGKLRCEAGSHDFSRGSTSPFGIGFFQLPYEEPEG
jgi:hypothetical protein